LHVIQQLRDAWRVFRPRTLTQTHKGVQNLRREMTDVRAELRDIKQVLKDLHGRDVATRAEQARSLAAVERQIGTAVERLSANMARLDLRESQLRAIARRDIELGDHEASLAAVMNDAEVRAHIERRCAGVVVATDPFPYVTIDTVLPQNLYDALVRGLPPVELFNDRLPNKRQLTVPFRLAPSYSCRVWAYMARTVVPQVLMPVLLETFRPVVDAWMRQEFPALGEHPIDEIEMNASDGRILLRTRGYVIPPHRDPKWGFLTGILYLARPGDSQSWGTQFYRVEADEESRGALPHWVPDARCVQVADVAFVPNRLIVFLNSTGAHGARIPEEAPESLERYIYQFRLGPRSEGVAQMMDTLPPDRRAFWAGKIADY
jgi:hypothetical protein